MSARSEDAYLHMDYLGKPSLTQPSKSNGNADRNARDDDCLLNVVCVPEGLVFFIHA